MQIGHLCLNSVTFKVSEISHIDSCEFDWSMTLTSSMSINSLTPGQM